MVGGFFGEDLGKFSVFWGKGLLGFLGLCFHGKVHGHGEFVDCGCGNRGEELGATSLDVVDDVGVHGSFHELFWEFSTKVPANTRLFCGIQSGFLARVDFGGE